MAKIDYDSLYASVDNGGIIDFSPTSIALAFMALGYVNRRYLWGVNDAPLDDAQWNVLDADISLALDELMSNLVGMIFPSAVATVSAFKMLPCDGSIYFRSDYPLLYDALDETFILSGEQFMTPDLTDRFLVGSGDSYDIGETGGVNSVTLTTAEMPAHSHGFTQYTFGVDIESVGVPDPTGVGQPRLPESTDSAGGGDAHENRPPYFAIPFYIVAG